ncbi:MAG: hypothetical protein V7645_1062 [Actinomycetota bacterium]
MYLKNPIIPMITVTISPTIAQNAAWVCSPGKRTFIPKIPEMSVSGSRITENTVRIRKTSFWRCEITDSFVLSSASTTSL